MSPHVADAIASVTTVSGLSRSMRWARSGGPNLSQATRNVIPVCSKGSLVKVLVATNHTQGMRAWDICCALEGELVMRPPVTCDCPDCPCEREMVGLSSRAGTTTFTVADVTGLDSDMYREMVCDELVACGWVLNEPEDTWLSRFVDRHLKAAGAFEVGALLEIGDDRSFVPRMRPEQPAT
jgi:hypothetical protein